MGEGDVQYGYFDPAKREYVITNPTTPVKWINYIGRRSFGGFVDHTGGALICKDDPTFNRITKYIHQLPCSQFNGETLYIRLHTPAGYRVYSPFFVPTLDPLDRYECAVGLGYTRITSEFSGLRTTVTIFVPSGETCEVRSVDVSNISDQQLMVDVIPAVEYSHPDALQQFTNMDWIPQTMQSRAVEDGDFLILVQYPFMLRDTRINFMTSNRPASSYDTDRRYFLGDDGSFAKPNALFELELGNSQAKRGDNIAAMLHPFGGLAPGETRRLIVLLGQAANLDAAKEMIDRYREPGEVRTALDDIRAYWKRYLEVQQVDTPDDRMDIMINAHNPYQCYVAKSWSRSLSMYQTGLGSRGVGYRDSMQDILGVVASVPGEAKDYLELLLSFQKPDGSAVHQFNPLTLQGSAGDSLEMEDRPHYYSDDHLWGILSVCAYLKETGEWEFLERPVPYYSAGNQSGAREIGTVRDHLDRALEFTRGDIGRHGLPRLGFADWNDTVNLPKGAESLFTAHLYGKALLEFIELADFLGDDQAIERYREAYGEMRARVEACGWDGGWYRRYFDEAGEPLGSAENIYGKIYLNAQSWAVISGFASAERGRAAMDAAHKRLNSKYGLRLSAPGFDGYDPKYGGVTTYPPGAKENGGIFLHPNPWAMIAEAMLGNGDRAYEYYAQINPVAKNDIIELYECEPYVYAQNILGPEHPQFGLGRNSWLTGAASWCYLAATQWILGIRPEYGGLRLDPCIPSSWSGFSTTRIFRDREFQITVHNPNGVCKTISRIELDGSPLDKSLIHADKGPGRHIIEAWLG
jgi:cellobiose phosphorylase